MLTTRHGVRVLESADLSAFLRLSAQDPVVNVFADHRARTTNLEPRWLGGEVWGRFAGGELVAACHVGANLVPVQCTPTTRGRSPSGPWPGAARSRPSSARTRRSSRSGRPSRPRGAGRASSGGGSRTSRSAGRRRSSRTRRCRRTTRADLEELYPACVAMYTEEVGVSPEAGGGAELYRARVSQLISRGWSFARFDKGRLVFKAEVACASPQAAQIQGVYVPPDRRGQGLAAAGMAAVVSARPAARRAGRLALRQRLERAGPARLRAGRVHPVGDVLDCHVRAGARVAPGRWPHQLPNASHDCHALAPPRRRGDGPYGRGWSTTHRPEAVAVSRPAGGCAGTGARPARSRSRTHRRSSPGACRWPQEQRLRRLEVSAPNQPWTV